jgi:hypothetical protein
MNEDLLFALKTLHLEERSKSEVVQKLVAFLKEKTAIQISVESADEIYNYDIELNQDGDSSLIQVILIGEPINEKLKSVVSSEQIYHIVNASLLTKVGATDEYLFLVLSENAEDLLNIELVETLGKWNLSSMITISSLKNPMMNFHLNPTWGIIKLNRDQRELFWRVIQYQKINVEKPAIFQKSELEKEYWYQREKNRSLLYKILKDHDFWKNVSVTVGMLVQEFYRLKKLDVERVLGVGDDTLEVRNKILSTFQGIKRVGNNAQSGKVGSGANFAQIVLHTINHPGRMNFGNIPEINDHILRAPEKNCHYFILDQEFNTKKGGFLDLAISRFIIPQENEQEYLLQSRFNEFTYYYTYGNGQKAEKKLSMEQLKTMLEGH